MNKQDFQEQDFMEFLMRLPCPCKESLFYLQGEGFILAGINVSTCRDKYFSLRRTKVMDSSEICNRQRENNCNNADS